MEITITMRRTSFDRWSVVTHLRAEDGFRIARWYNVIRDPECSISPEVLARVTHGAAKRHVEILTRQGKLF